MRNIVLGLSKKPKPSGTQRHRMRRLNKALTNSRKYTKKRLKKAFRSRLLEICKTRAKKSSPDVFKFYVDVAGHDMVSDNGKGTTCRRTIEAPSLQTKSTRNDGSSENMSFKGEQIEDFRQKK